MLATVSEEFRAGLAAGVRSRSAWQARGVCRAGADVIDHDYINGEAVRMDGALRMAPR